MKITPDQQFAAVGLIAALNSKALVDLCELGVRPLSPLLTSARSRAHDAISPNFIEISSLRICLVQHAINIAEIVVPKQISKSLKNFKVDTLDDCESVIGAGRHFYMNSPTAKGLAAL